MQAHNVWRELEPCGPKSMIEEKTYKVTLAIIYEGIPEDMLLFIVEKKNS